MGEHKYAIFYPEHTGYLHVKQLGGDGGVNLVWNIRDEKPYTRRKWWPVHRAPSNGLNQLSHYREGPGLPKLIHSQSFKHESQKDDPLDSFSSNVFIWEYWNGGNLSRFDEHILEEVNGVKRTQRVLEKDSALEVFIWHFFDSILTIFNDLHEQKVTHPRGGTDDNVFFHFTDLDPAFPKICLGNLEWLSAFNHYNFERQLGGLFLNITMLMCRRRCDRFGESAYCGDYTIEDNVVGKLSNFSKELFDCRIRLGQLCYGYLKEQNDEEFDFEPMTREDRDKPGMKLFGELRAAVAKSTKQAMENLKSLPNLSSLRRDKPAIKPAVYESRAELLEVAMKGLKKKYQFDPVSGPWRIARVDGKTFDIIGVEKTDYQLHDPMEGPNCSEKLDKAGREWGQMSRTAVEKLAKQGKDIFKLAKAQDEAKDNKIVHPIFELDPEFGEKRLHYTKAKDCQPCVDRLAAFEKLGFQLTDGGLVKTPKKRKGGKSPASRAKNTSTKKAGGASATSKSPSKPAGVLKVASPSKAKKPPKKQAKPQTMGTRSSRRVLGKAPEVRGLK